MRYPLCLSLAALPFLILPAAVAALTVPQTYVNTAIARTIELGGATTHVTTQYNVKVLKDGPGDYQLALAGKDEVVPAWWEVSVGGKGVQGITLLESSIPTVSVPLGKNKKDDTLTLTLTHVLTHASTPLPNEIAQRDAQYMLYLTNSTYVDSWYPTDVERVKIRAPHPVILAYDKVPITYTRDNTVTKSGGTLTLGPFHSLPPTLGDNNDKVVEQQAFSVHYEVKEPVLGYRYLKRSAEVSHWGANLNIQDEVALVNNGAKLKGHFSRLEHQQSKFHAGLPAQVLSEFALKLPPTAHSVYYYDTIGNVSTSHFRQGSTPAQSAKSAKVRTSPRTVDGNLEIRPRYPLLGGWNYTFVVGWDMPLGDVLKSQREDGKKVLSIPFLTPLKDVVVDKAEVTIILPEGASDVQLFTPFPVDSIVHKTHKTYLDTTGRYAVTITKAHVTEQHAQNVFVTYTYPLSAQLQKPLAVASLVASLFVLSMGLRRVNYSLEKK